MVELLQPHLTNPAPGAAILLKRFNLLFLTFSYLLLLLLAAGCGQVITKPTPTIVIPTATPTPPRATATATPVPTATPIPATPAPTPTPTPEPTPIIHTLQAGDTLIGLARKYGVTVQAIQEANGITDPRGLLVGQQIIIPTDAEARLSAGKPTPSPTPPPMNISPLTFWQQNGDLWALGQLISNAEQALENVVVQVQLLDDAGASVAQAQTTLPQYMLAPGETGGFRVRFSSPGDFTSYYTQVLSAQPAHTDFYHRDFDIQNLLVQDDGDTYTLSGEIVNTGSDLAHAVYISVTLYDPDGLVVGLRRVAADPADVPPGERAFFSASLMPVHYPVADYSLLVEGQRHAAANE